MARIHWGTVLLAGVVVVTSVAAGCRAPAGGRPASGESSTAAPWGRTGDVLRPERFDSGAHAGRTWLTYVPATLRRRAPLVLVLHGGGGSALNSATAYPLGRWQEVAADRAGGMVVVYADAVAGPDGRARWNDCRPDAADRPVDDVGFLVALAERAVAEHGADPEQVHVVGVSNGGMMALRLAAERPDVVAGAGVIAASMPAGECGEPTEPVAMAFVAGTDDPLMPVGGGRISGDRGDVVGLARTVETWRAVNAADPVGDPSRLPDLDRRDGPRRSSSTVTRTDYRGSAPVTVFRVDGGGHTVPDREIDDPLPPALVGAQNRDVDAAALVADALG